MKNLLLFTLLFISVRHATAEKAPMSVTLSRCTGYCNPEYCKIVLVCRPLNWTSKFVSTDIYLHPGITLKAPVYIEIVALKKFRTVYRPHMLKLKTELCTQLSLMTHPLLALRKEKTFISNFIDPCPISGHRYTKPRISSPEDYAFPETRLVPAGEWRVDVTISLKENGSEKVVVSWSDYFDVKSLTAEEF